MTTEPKSPPRSYAHAPRIPAGEVDLREIVPGDGPLMLEVGSGRGAFALDYAALHPDHRVLAFEIRLKYAAQLDERFAARKLAQARCFADDARDAMPRLAPDGCVDFVAVHFPDPWWKKKHNKRLVLGDALTPQIVRLLRPGGLLFVQTDVEARADEYFLRFSAATELENTAPAGQRYVAESPFAPARSNREKRAIEDGLPVYRMVFRRR